MSKVYMFPGQGSQEVGMGGELFDEFPEKTAAADAILGYSIKDLCLNGPLEKLSQTEYTQPALYVVNALTYLARLQENPAKPEFTAGHSLGEYNALFAAGVFDFETGLKLVQKRGAIMSKVAGGGMAAVIGMPPEKIQTVLADSGNNAIDIANLNSPKQTVLSGMKNDIVNAEEAFKEAGARRYIVLGVSGAFHSRYMEEPEAEFKEFASQFEFKTPEIPVISNLKAAPYETDSLLPTLAGQISNSVRWVESIQYIRSQGEFEFEELGPKNVLTGLLRQIG
jgi:malonyl CoA-acyl carrier protein transacylase